MAAAYPSIPHLPGSRTGPADRTVSDGQARLCTGTGDPRDTVIVQEKLDGSCVVAARVGDDIVALGREGRPAAESRNEARRWWARWVAGNAARFLAVLRPGQRLAGEWLALAHATRYELRHEPFVCFDLLAGPERLPYAELLARIGVAGFVAPGLVHRGDPIDTPTAMSLLGAGTHGAIDPVEGAVWRVERTVGSTTRVILVAKYVRPDKIDGALLPEITGQPAIYNWEPER